MEKIPANLLYSKEHEWALVEDDLVTVGITSHAASQLGDVVYVELPEPGKQLTKDKVFGVVESVKAVSDLFAPVSGEVVETNSALVEKPEGINEDPYKVAWMIKVRASNKKELAELMDASHYDRYLKEHIK